MLCISLSGVALQKSPSLPQFQSITKRKQSFKDMATMCYCTIHLHEAPGVCKGTIQAVLKRLLPAVFKNKQTNKQTKNKKNHLTTSNLKMQDQVSESCLSLSETNTPYRQKNCYLKITQGYPQYSNIFIRGIYWRNALR